MNSSSAPLDSAQKAVAVKEELPFCLAKKLVCSSVFEAAESA